MIKIICAVFVCTIFWFTTSAQSLDQKDIYHLQATIFNFLSDQENSLNSKNKRPSEFVVCLLQIDSNGKIKNIHLFADGNNKDSIFQFLSRMTPLIFNDWKCQKCKGKTIMMPIVSISHGKKSPDYMKNLIDERFVKPIAVISETDKLIIVTPTQYAPSVDERENPLPEIRKIDTLKRN